MAKWRLQQREEQLYREATKIPTWVLADISRRVLLDACRQLWESTPTATADSYEKPSPRDIGRLVVLHLGQIIVRATGAQMMLIATGYERQGFGQARVTTEAHLRTRRVLDDKSGESAIAVMAGHTCVEQTVGMAEMFELGVLAPPAIGEKLCWYRDNPLTARL